MAARELVVLGTASQAPTRTRNHNGYFLRWDDTGFLFDPGEGTQRQLVHAGIAASAVETICVTHFHGDHCLGLPGVLQRLCLDGASEVTVCFPGSGTEYFERLRHASVFHETTLVHARPVDADGVVAEAPPLTISAARLDHAVETFGWRIDEAPGRRMLPDRLAAHGVCGPDIGRVQRDGTVEVDGAVVRLDQVSAPKPGQAFAFVMDTGFCPAAIALARDADLLVCEATFLERDADLAGRYRHLTARQAATIAREAGVRRLVLTHFSQRYADLAEHEDEAGAVFDDVVVARDLAVVPLPPRRQVSP